MENSYDNKTFSMDTLLTFASGNHSKSDSSSNNRGGQCIQLTSKNGNDDNANSVLYLKNTDNDEYQQKYVLLNQQNHKDCSDLFAVESTVI